MEVYLSSRRYFIARFVGLRMTQQDSTARERPIRDFQGHKFSIIGRLLPNIVHEINNPMQAIKGGAMLALEEENLFEPVTNYLRIILNESDRILSLTTFLRNLCSEKTSDPIPIDLEKMIDQILQIMKDDLNRKGLRFDFLRPQTPCYVKICESDIQLALLDLWLNINTTLHNLDQKEFAVSIMVSKSATMLDFSFDTVVQIHCQKDGQPSVFQNVIDISRAEAFITPQGGKIVLDTTPEQSHLFITLPSAADNLQMDG